MNSVDPSVCTAVEDYFEAQLLHGDPLPKKVLEFCLTQAIPKIHITPTQGKFLQLLVQISGAKRVLEIGTLGGYSAVWMALGLPADGHLITIDFDPKCVAIAQHSIALAGLEDRITIQQGRASECLQAMIDSQQAPFDLVFIDADKENNPQYLRQILQLAHSGTVIIADNVVRKGKIIQADYKGNNIRGLRQFLSDIHNLSEHIEGTALQTMVPRGWDGIGIFRVK